MKNGTVPVLGSVHVRVTDVPSSVTFTSVGAAPEPVDPLDTAVVGAAGTPPAVTGGCGRRNTTRPTTTSATRATSATTPRAIKGVRLRCGSSSSPRNRDSWYAGNGSIGSGSTCWYHGSAECSSRGGSGTAAWIGSGPGGSGAWWRPTRSGPLAGSPGGQGCAGAYRSGSAGRYTPGSCRIGAGVAGSTAVSAWFTGSAWSTGSAAGASTPRNRCAARTYGCCGPSTAGPYRATRLRLRRASCRLPSSSAIAPSSAEIPRTTGSSSPNRSCAPSSASSSTRRADASSPSSRCTVASRRIVSITSGSSGPSRIAATSATGSSRSRAAAS